MRFLRILASGHIQSEINYNIQTNNNMQTNIQTNTITYFKSGKINEKYININNIRITEKYNENGLLINYLLYQDTQKPFNLEFKSIDWYPIENKESYLQALTKFSEIIQKSIDNYKIDNH